MMNENYRELSPKELEQVNGGFDIGSAKISKVHQGRGGSTVTANSRLEPTSGYSM